MAVSAFAETPFSYESYVNEILPGGRIILNRGYKNNSDYSKAKTPIGAWLDSPQPSEAEITQHISKGGWIGVVIPEGVIVVDIDNPTQGRLVKDLLEGENVHHHCIKSPNGWQFVFAANEEMTKEIKQITKFFTQIGVVIDTRTAGAGYIIFPTENTEGRYVVTNSLNELDELPHYLRPIRNSLKVKDKATNEPYEFPIPIQGAGSRNDTLYNWASHLKAWNVVDQEINKAMELVYENFLLDKTDFPENELKALTQSAIKWKPEPSNQGFQLELNDNYTGETIIPLPFHIKGNALFKIVLRKENGGTVEENVMIARMTPIILRELSNVERNSVHYEIAWTDRGREKREVVSASTISTKRELLILADSGLPVNDLNYKDLIGFFDKYLAYNELEQAHMVERLGHIKNAFIHPLDSEGVEIIPNDMGEKQLLEAFQVKGTAETWKTEVFDRVKEHPKVLFMVLASFASVLLKDLKVSPFIVDLSGSTSQGKTTALQVARSVWGTEGLINEWNATKVSIERKTGFLNSFPLFLDDTRKAQERILQSIVYQFSGGRSKGRGSLKGSQSEMTWNNILISTGEVSLTEYAAKAGGAAARIITLVDQPFERVRDNYFSEVYEAIENNHGAIGLEFIQAWQHKKDSLISDFHNIRDHYMKKSNGNEVLTRLSMYYAAVHFAGLVARDVFNLEMDLKILDRLFNEIAEENKAIDKPRELLEEILMDLDADRNCISGHYVATRQLKAVCKDGTLHLLPAYLKEFLGPEMKMVRTEWRKRGITFSFEQKGKIVDYKQLKHGGGNHLVVPVAKDIVEDLGFNFDGC